MTRSLGDLCVKQHGITAEPEIETWDVKELPKESYILLASDGVWDFMPCDEVSDLEARLQDGKYFLFHICNSGKAKMRWFSKGGWQTRC